MSILISTLSNFIQPLNPNKPIKAKTRITSQRYSFPCPELGNIKVQYPDCAAVDHVSQSWLSTYFNDLPDGTVIHKPDGKTIKITKPGYGIILTP